MKIYVTKSTFLFLESVYHNATVETAERKWKLKLQGETGEINGQVAPIVDLADYVPHRSYIDVRMNLDSMNFEYKIVNEKSVPEPKRNGKPKFKNKELSDKFATLNSNIHKQGDCTIVPDFLYAVNYHRYRKLISES